MLATDRQLLLAELKQDVTELKQKEFNLHHGNLRTVGTQAAVLATLDVVMFIEFAPPPDAEWGDMSIWIARSLKFLYYVTIVSAFCANMIVVSHTTALSVYGTGLALRGPDGSMMTATDGLYAERRSVFSVFRFGVACTVGSCVMGVWLILSWEAAALCMLVAIYTCYKIYKLHRRVLERFYFHERETVDFRDIFEGPAAIKAVPMSIFRRDGGVQKRSPSRFKEHRSFEDESSDEEMQPNLERGAWKRNRVPNSLLE